MPERLTPMAIGAEANSNEIGDAFWRLLLG